MLASPEVGFIVPTKAIIRSGQNAVVTANPAPVAAISRLATRSRRRSDRRLATSPIHSVSTAVPTRVLLTMAPIAKALKPRSSR